MGKWQEQHEHVLSVKMHCQCSGCVKKINNAVKEMSLSEGVKRADLVVEKAELRVVGTMDPEKLCSSLYQLTKKDVKIETHRTMSEGSPAASKQDKNRVGWPGSFRPRLLQEQQQQDREGRRPEQQQRLPGNATI